MIDTPKITVTIKGLSLDAEAEVTEGEPRGFYLTYRLHTSASHSHGWLTPMTKFASPQQALRHFFSNIVDTRLKLY